MADGSVSIPSSMGSTVVFTITGEHTLAYAQMLSTLFGGAADQPAPDGPTPPGAVGDLNVVQAGSGVLPDAAPGYVNEAVLVQTDPGSVPTVVVGPGYGLLYDQVEGQSAATITGGGTSVLVAGGPDAAATISSAGGNTIIFADGNNLYVGSGNGDLVVGGDGHDMIQTGTGATSVFGGAGGSTIVLNDTAGGSGAPGPVNDVAVLDGGQSMVVAAGANDAVLALSPGQTVFGGQSDDGMTNRANVLLAGGDGLVVGNAGVMAVEAFSSGNTVFSGSGALFVAAGSGENTVVGTNGGTVLLFGGDGASLTYGDDGSIPEGQAWFVAGNGNETLNAGGASDGLVVFGASDPAGAAGDREVLVAGSGNDTFLTGMGAETLTGGAGHNDFVVHATGTANSVLITDFGASAGNVVGFAGYSAAEVSAALASATTVQSAYGSGVEITLGDGTTVQFIGVSSLTGHTH